MKYRYLVTAAQRNTDGRSTKRPIVEVELSRGNQTRKFLALVDSGADQIHMPAAIAEVFGIDRATCPRWSSMGISMERIDGFIGQLTFRIKNQADTFTAPVVFIDTDLPVLLGREGFFDRYRIKFEQDHDTFEIHPSFPGRLRAHPLAHRDAITTDSAGLTTPTNLQIRRLRGAASDLRIRCLSAPVLLTFSSRSHFV